MRSPLEFGRSLLPRSPSDRLRLEQDILEEFQFHVDCRTEANLECGMSAEEARESALRQFGDPESILDACIESHETHPARRAARFAARVLPIGVACGFAAAVLLVLYALVVRLPATYPPEGNWAVVWWEHTDTGLLRSDSSVEDFEAWSKGTQTADYVGLGTYHPVVSQFNGISERLMAKYVARDYLREHGIRPTIGRIFRGDTPDAVDHPILISHQLWERRYESSREVLGTTLDVDGVPHTIVGVAPQEYQTYFPFDFFAPFELKDFDPSRLGCLVAARLRPGVTLEEAQREFAALKTDVAGNTGWQVYLRRPQEVYGGRYPRSLLPYGLLAAMLLVVAIVKMRSKGGQVSWSELPSTFAGIAAVGLATAVGSTEILRNTVLAQVDQRFNFGIDAPVTIGFLALVLLAVLACGLPTRSAGIGKRADGRENELRRFSPALVLTNAVAFLMLVSAVIVTYDWWQRGSPDVGFDAEQVFTVPIVLPATEFADRETRRTFFKTTIDRLDELESIDQYSFTNRFPTVTDPEGVSVLIPDSSDADSGTWTRIAARAVGRNFFETTGIAILEGRPFHTARRDGRAVSAVINAGMAERYWPDGSAVGRLIRINGDVELEITAIAANSVSSILGDEKRSMIYPLIWQWTVPQTIVVRSTDDFAEVAEKIRRVIEQIDPAVTVGEMAPGNSALVATARRGAITAGCLWFLALMALLLSSSFTFRSVRNVADRGVRVLSLRQLGRPVQRVAFRPLFAGVAASLIAGALLSTPVVQLLAKEMNLNLQGGILHIVAPAILLVAMHAAVGYVPFRQLVKLSRVSHSK